MLGDFFVFCVVMYETLFGSSVMNDQEMYQKLLDGDQGALKKLIDLYSTSVFKLVSHILEGMGSEQDVEECCSDVFFTCWNEIDRYQPDRASLRTFLLMLAKYISLDRRRKLTQKQPQIYSLEERKLKGREAVGTTNLPEDFLEQKEQRQKILRALETLSPLDKELVYRRYFLYEKIEDLAEKKELSRQALDNRLWRARKILRAYLQDEEKGTAGFIKKGGDHGEGC